MSCYANGVISFVMCSSMLVMQGRSADFARYALPSIRKQRILVTLVKSQPKKTNTSDTHHFPSISAHSPSRAPPRSRSPGHIRPLATKHFGPIPPTGIIPGPTARQQLPLPNGIQQMFVPTPVAFPAPVALPPPTASWPVAPPRHPQPRLPVPGTGVFLPSQNSGNSSNAPPSGNITMDSSGGPEENGVAKSNGIQTSPKAEDVQVPEHESNGRMDGKEEEGDSNRGLGKSDGPGLGKQEREM